MDRQDGGESTQVRQMNLLILISLTLTLRKLILKMKFRTNCIWLQHQQGQAWIVHPAQQIVRKREAPTVEMAPLFQYVTCVLVN